MRRIILIMVGLAVAYTGLAGCVQIFGPKHGESQSSEGRVIVDAPFTHVNVPRHDHD